MGESGLLCMVMIRDVTPGDSEAIARIYNYYVENTCITFEETAVDPSEMKDRILESVSVLPWLVYEDNGDVVGYSYASRWKGRCAYRYAVESTVYLDRKAKGKGIGTELYKKLICRLAEKQVHAIIGGIALPNPASVRMHEKLGFEKVAHFKEVGWKFEKWIDVGYWQRVLKHDN